MKDLNQLCLWCFHDLKGKQVCPHCGKSPSDKVKNSYDLQPGTVLHGRYIVGGEVGAGGFGITYKAYDVTLDIIIAIKEFYPREMLYRAPGKPDVEVFSPDQAELYKGRLARFIDEAQAQALFATEPEIPTVYDHFEENGTAYIAMEFIEGILISDYLKQYGKIGLEDATAIFREILEALEKLHKHGIIHRDLSADNIFICAGNHIKLFDFGAAYLNRKDQNNMYEEVVKAGYTPPEQYREGYTPKPTIDVYAAGALYYEMLTGQRPISALDRMADVQLEKPSSHGVSIPANIENAIMQAMELQVDYRFQSISEFLGVIREGKKTKKKMVNKKTLIAGGIAAAILVIGTIFIAFTLYSSDLMHYKPKEDTTISVWLVLDDDMEIGKDGRNNIQKNIQAGFEEKYPTVKLNISYIREDDYAEELKKVSDDKLPDIYCTDYLEEGRVPASADLSPLVDKLNNVSYLFEDSYLKSYGNKHEIPTGFQIATYYRNTTKKSLDEDNIGLNMVNDSVNDGSCQWVDTCGDNDATYHSMCSKSDNIDSVAGSLSLYQSIQNVVVSGKKQQMEIVPIMDGEKILASFKNCYSVRSTGDKNKEKASMLFLHHILGNTAQRELYLKQDYALPINAKAFQEYMENLDIYNLDIITQYIEVTGDRNVSFHITNRIEMDANKRGVVEAYGK